MEQRHLLDRRRHRLKRRDLIAMVAASAVLPLAARSEGAAMPRIAVVTQSLPLAQLGGPAIAPQYQIFFEALARRGRVEGKTLAVERYSAAEPQLGFAVFAQMVAARAPDAIVVFGGNDFAAAFEAATARIPLVAVTGDPIASGLVASLAHPGGNFTGVSVDAGPGLGTKRLGILLEAFPGLKQVGFLGVRIGWDRIEGSALRDAAARAGIDIVPLILPDVPAEADYRTVLAAFANTGPGGIVVSAAAVNIANRDLVVALAQNLRMPAIFAYREDGKAGALISYGIDRFSSYARLAEIVDDVLKGTRPGEIPIAQPTRFYLVVNLKTAKAQGFTMPSPLVLRADEVIE